MKKLRLLVAGVVFCFSQLAIASDVGPQNTKMGRGNFANLY